MAFDIVTPAVEEPITLTEAKNFLRVDHDDDNNLISALITAARQMCEEYTRRILVTTTVDEYFDEFPTNNWSGLSNIIYLSRGPVASISSVKYVDEIGSEVTVPRTAYVADVISEPARIQSTAGWFSGAGVVNQVIVRYVVGSDVSAIPKPLIQGMMLVISDLYDQRGDRVRRMPTASEYLFNPYRIFTF
jgi:uncharacterized phiE125 gp8 family phage protein